MCEIDGVGRWVSEIGGMWISRGVWRRRLVDPISQVMTAQQHNLVENSR
jgi:hypothetical protein